MTEPRLPVPSRFTRPAAVHAEELLSLRPDSIRGMNLLLPGKKVRVDATLPEVKAADFDALLLPGGFINPDLLRQRRKLLGA